MAAQGAFGTDFYDRSILRTKHRAYYRSGRPVIKIGPKDALGCFLLTSWYLEELEDFANEDIELGPHFEVKTCDRSDDGFQPKPVTGFYLKVGRRWSMLSSPRSPYWRAKNCFTTMYCSFYNYGLMEITYVSSLSHPLFYWDKLRYKKIYLFFERNKVCSKLASRSIRECVCMKERESIYNWLGAARYLHKVVLMMDWWPEYKQPYC